jgi:hypothetical protein
MRTDGGTGYPVVATLPANTNGTIIDGPRLSTGYTWWRLRTTTGLLGWVAQTYLVRTSGLPPEFTIGASVRFRQASQRRSNPALPDTRITPDVPSGTWAVVIAGPREAYSRLWWQVRYGSQIGWVPQEVLIKGTKLSLGASVRTTQRVTTLTDVNNWNSRGAIAGGVFGAVISSSPKFAHGYLWYSARFAEGIFWIPQDYLQIRHKFATGTGVRTTQRVTTLSNINDWSSRGAIDGNQYGVTMTSPRWTNGNLWYQVRFTDGIYWVPQDYLERGNKFSVGMQVVTTQRVTGLANVTNMATGIAVEDGTAGLVTYPARWAHGRLWYAVRFSFGSYWVPQDFLRVIG